MAKHVSFILLIIIILAGCTQHLDSEPINEITEFRSGYSFSDDIYEYCGEQSRADGNPGFDLYCFVKFQTMARCRDSDIPQKEYSDCEYDAHISVRIDENKTNSSPEKLLTSLLVKKHPSTIDLHNAPETLFMNLLKESSPSTTILFFSEQENPNEAIVAEISFAEDETTTTLLTVIDNGKDMLITIECKSSNSYGSVVFREAFDTFISSLSAADMSQFPQT